MNKSLFHYLVKDVRLSAAD